MPAVTVILLVRPETASEMPRSALSVAGQDTGDWELRIVHDDDPDLVAAAADLAQGDPRVSGAATVADALAGSQAPIVCWLESGARYPPGYVAAVVSAMADAQVRCTVAARLLEHGPRFMLSEPIRPDGVAAPCHSQVAVRRRDAEGPLSEVLASGGRRDLPDLVVATRFGEVEGYFTSAEDELCLLLQVETKAALESLEDIATVEGVDGIFIGPADLAASMGHPGDAGHPEVVAAIEDAIARLKAIGVPSGILTLDPAFARRCILCGTTFTAVAVDTVTLAKGARALCEAVRPPAG